MLDDDGNGTLPNTQTFTDLAPGTYSVTETATAGWSLTNLLCTDPDSGTTVNLNTRTATVDLDRGETVTCTFTNTNQGRITVIKQVVGTAPTTTWQFNGSAPIGSFTFATGGGQRMFHLNPGNYTLTETTKTNYRAMASCTSGATGTTSVTVNLRAGQHITCTFVNINDNVKIMQGNGGCLQIDLDKRTYRFKTSRGTFTGSLVFTRNGNVIRFQNARGDNQLLRGEVNLVTGGGNAVLVLPISQGGGTFMINDSNSGNNAPCS
jgi:hypothetical protein